jgi:hypothetical protein
MTKDTTKEAAVAAEALLLDDWFDTSEGGGRRPRGLCCSGQLLADCAFNLA